MHITEDWWLSWSVTTWSKDCSVVQTRQKQDGTIVRGALCWLAGSMGREICTEAPQWLSVKQNIASGHNASINELLSLAFEQPSIFPIPFLILLCNKHLRQVLLYRSHKNSNIKTKHSYNAMVSICNQYITNVYITCTDVKIQLLFHLSTASVEVMKAY